MVVVNAIELAYKARGALSSLSAQWVEACLHPAVHRALFCQPTASASRILPPTAET